MFSLLRKLTDKPTGHNMILDFLSKFESIAQASSFLQMVEPIAKHFLEEYTAQGSAKDAAIDALIQYLQSLKGK